jgi:hypothetical protein
MVAKRGEPSSERLRTLRDAQADVAAAAAHRDLACVAAMRLDLARGDEGLIDPAAFGHPVTEEESRASAVRAGDPVPRSVHALLQRARAAPLPDLVAAGAVPSAEVLATLIPSVTASTVSQAYDDADLGALMSTTYLAFRRRRSLLLLNLQRQVQFAELPWVRAVAPYGRDRRPDNTLHVARQVGQMALDAFPGTILPNLLVRELNQLLAAADLPNMLTEEVAADIFMGLFSDKFLDAARAAGRLVGGSLYARYYDLDYRELDHLDPDSRRRPIFPWPRRTPAANTFAGLCARRAGSAGRSWSPARNGTIIEQAQLFTTHNLAALVHIGVRPTRPWPELALAAYERAERLVALSLHQSRPLPTVKDAAYAWRQALFFLSLSDDAAVQEFLHQARRTLAANPLSAAHLQTLLGGLEDVHHGHPFDAEGNSPHGKRLLGWTTSRHWLTDTSAGPH